METQVVNMDSQVDRLQPDPVQLSHCIMGKNGCLQLVPGPDDETPVHTKEGIEYEIKVKGTVDMGKGVQTVEFAVGLYDMGEINIVCTELPSFWAEFTPTICMPYDALLYYPEQHTRLRKGQHGCVGKKPPALEFEVDEYHNATLTCKNNPAFRIAWLLPQWAC
jgi:hypothetical protein